MANTSCVTSLFARRISRCFSGPSIHSVGNRLLARKYCVLQSNTMAKILVSQLSALIDEKITIKVMGLARNQPITVKASLSEGKMKFASYGWFAADDNGNVDISQNKSLHGTYTDVDSMGLFWSMKPEPDQPPDLRLFKRDVTTPYHVHLSVLDGHLPWEHLFDESNLPLTEKVIERFYKAPNVRREIIRKGNVRGALFIPPGKGPFPAVIDIFGSGGGLIEHRAALLASRGFLTLALAFFDYDDLPKHMGDVSLDYMIESTKWFCSLPMVRDGKVAYVGVSKGAELAMLTALHCPEIIAVTNINGPPFITATPVQSLESYPHVELNFELTTINDEGISFRNSYEPKDEDFIKIWEADVKMLTLLGEDDMCFSHEYTLQHKRLIPEEKRDNFEYVLYPKAGHLIEPPYAPFCRASFHKMIKMNMIWGGSPKEHSFAQEDAWKRTLQFLKTHLGNAHTSCDGHVTSNL